MALLYGYGFRYALSGQLEDTAYLPLARDAVSFRLEKNEAEYVQSDSPAPSKVYDLGFTGEIRAILLSHSQDDLARVLNGELLVSGTVKVEQKTSEKQLYDCSFYVKGSGGYSEHYVCEKFFITGRMEAVFKRGNLYYLPVIFKPSARAVIQITRENNE